MASTATTAPLLAMLHDIFIRSVSKLADQMLQEYIDQNCVGCKNDAVRLKNPLAHDICIMMSWSDQVINFLPDILKKLKVKTIMPTFTMTFNRIRPKFNTREMKDVPIPFNLNTFLYTYLEDMRNDVSIQKSIAQSIYGVYRSHRAENIVEFGKRYETIIKAKQTNVIPITIE